MSIVARHGNATYRIMTSNIWGGKGGGKDMPIANRDDCLAKVILQYEPDVIGLQEVSPKARQEPVNLFHLLHDSYMELAVDIGELSNNYTPLVYRKEKFDILDCGFHRYSGMNDSNSKTVTWAVLASRGTGERFAVCNTHFFWKQDDAGREARIHNSKELVQLVGSITQKHDVPILCMGDFNCQPSSEPIGILLNNGFVKAQSAAASHRSFSNSHHPYPEWDETRKLFVNGPLPTGSYDQAIDHILYNGDTARIWVYETITSQDALDASDHCPVFVDVSFEGGTASR